MFIEPNIKNDRRGWIEVICGSMFSGKTEELIRHFNSAKISNLKEKILKHSFDIILHLQNIKILIFARDLPFKGVVMTGKTP